MLLLKKWKKLSSAEKIYFFVINFVKLTLFVAVPFSIYEKDWMTLFIVFIVLLIVIFSPKLEKKYKINVPPEFQIAITIFVYAGLFLGETKNYYTKFWWWDIFLHSFSGVALGFVGFLILYILYKSGKFSANLKIIMLFSFSFAVALGVLWEIFEFGIDIFSPANMQQAKNLGDIYFCNTHLGVKDTMYDLILNGIGAFVASLSGYFYLKGGETPVLGGLVKKFEEENPFLFKK
jgi:energy-coupling factor transporter transmembrane protein EcfT